MRIQKIIYTALFAAIIAALGIVPPIPLPFSPVPITLQTLGVMLAGSLLGARYGGLSILLFVVLVMIGLPLLSGGRGGAGILFGAGGGYILCWPIGAFIIGWIAHSFKKPSFPKYLFANIVGGILVIYAGGVTYLSFLINIPWTTAAIQGLAFLPGDIFKAVVAGFVAVRLNKQHKIRL